MSVMSPTRAWAALVILSAGSTGLAVVEASGVLPVLAVLALAWVKARIILRHYLGLGLAPAWSRGFGLALALYMILVMGLVVAAG
jgi:hypothetical protein